MKFVWPLVAAVSTISFGFAVYEASAENRTRAEGFANQARRQAETLRDALETAPPAQFNRVLSRANSRDGVLGAMLLDRDGRPASESPDLRERLGMSNSDLAGLVRSIIPGGQPVRMPTYHLQAFAFQLDRAGQQLVAFQDTSLLEASVASRWRGVVLRALLQSVALSLIVLLAFRWSMVTPLRRLTQWTKDQLSGTAEPRVNLPVGDAFTPLTRQLTRLAADLRTARARATDEARLRDAGESLWTPERLRVYLEKLLEGSPLFVVSNRQPYQHVRKGNEVEVIVPASGLVTAMEPILRASNGTWIAHGAGDADRATVDAGDRLPVPPDDPRYTLRRVWLSEEQERGYYYGFANEGLWPLCHIAHTRPQFRPEDWRQYVDVNRKFADAVLQEMDGSDDPLVLVQDYHFALLPALIKDQRPDARVAIFWHIPWPNPEAFGICPWQTQLLEGLLGADLIGFHIQSHCNNFLQTVDRTLESRIDYEKPGVSRGDRFTAVRPFPISVEAPAPRPVEEPESRYLRRSELMRKLGTEAEFFGVGVDRLDYTKGIPERLRGIERFLDDHPFYHGKFCFVQVGAPTRTTIRRYQDLIEEVESEVNRINSRFGTRQWKPIIFLKRHHSHEEIDPYYRLSDFCLVTSLHDGMNLVAKEYVASRDDENGSVILSKFTGAAQELEDALLVNPYDAEEVAEAIRQAVEMDPAERSLRMKRMRQIVREKNIFRWAADLVSATADIRLDRTVSTVRNNVTPFPVATIR
jgi:trehalose 6-phosphate synthase